VGPNFLIPAGNWAEWAAAAGASGAILWGVISWSRDRKSLAADRRREIELLESEQARRVGLALGPKSGTPGTYVATVYNTSDLPIRHVRVFATARIVKDGKDVDSATIAFPPVPFIVGRDTYHQEATSDDAHTLVPGASIDWDTAIDFEDNDGTLWSKHAGLPVRKNLRGGTIMYAGPPPRLE
jgi:hypothetical protein